MVKRLFLALALAASLSVAAAGEVAAQTRADSAAVLLNAAERLRQQGDGAAARAVLELIARDYAGTPAAAEVGSMLALVRRMPEAERSGRTELMVWSSVYGAWLGVAVPLVADSEEPAAYGVGLLAGAPAGFFAARAYAQSRSLMFGQARAITFGGTFGTWQGFGWAEVLDIGADDLYCSAPGDCFEVEPAADAQALVASAVVGGLAGIAIGVVVARKPITAGTSRAVSHSGPWGTWFGWGLSYMAGTDGDDENLTAALLGGDIALIATGIMAPRWQLSESRARLISIAGVIGGLAGAGLMLIVQPEDDRTAVAFPLFASALGLGLGAYWTRDHDERAEDGNGGSALLNLDRGRWAMNLPEPALRLQRAARATHPTMYVPVLQARF